jgi:hypothetical protein
MNWPKRVFDFYLDASIHVALAVFVLVRLSALLLNIPWDVHLSLFLFFGTVTAYNFVKYGVEAKKYILVANNYHRNIQFVSFVCFVAAFYHAFFLNADVWEGVAVLLLLTGLYALPVLPRSRNLRSLGGLKIFIVAAVWAGATVHLPVMALERPLSWDVWMEGVQRFVFVLVLLLPFEIRDLQYDDPDLGTLPQRFGIHKTKLFGVVLTFVFFLLTFLKREPSVLDMVGKAVALVLLVTILYFTKREQAPYFSSFWVEAAPLFWFVIVWGIAELI